MGSDAPIAWTAGFLGAYLIYASIVNKNPVDQLIGVLTGDTAKQGRPFASSTVPAGSTQPGFDANGNPVNGMYGPPTPIAGANTTSSGVGVFAPVTSASPADQAAATAISNGSAPPRLTAIAGGAQLAAPAAAGYARASSLYGRAIPITGAYRSMAVQAAGYAQNPERFAPPEKSLHPKGLAIDVNSANMNDPALIAALSRTGWAQTALPNEPWHWSFGVRG